MDSELSHEACRLRIRMVSFQLSDSESLASTSIAQPGCQGWLQVLRCHGGLTHTAPGPGTFGPGEVRTTVG